MANYIPQEGEYIGRGIGKDLKTARTLAILDAKTQIAERILSQIEIKSRIQYTDKEIIVKKVITEYSNYIALNMKRLKEEWEKLPDGRWAYYILYFIPPQNLEWAREQILSDQEEIVDRLKSSIAYMDSCGEKGRWDDMLQQYFEIKKLSGNIILPEGNVFKNKAQVIFNKYLKKFVNNTISDMKSFIQKGDFGSAENAYLYFWDFFNSMDETQRGNWLEVNRSLINEIIRLFLDTKFKEMMEYFGTNKWNEFFEQYLRLKEICDTLTLFDPAPYIERANSKLRTYLTGIKTNISIENNGVNIRILRNNSPVPEVPIHVWSGGINPPLDVEVYSDDSGNAFVKFSEKTTIEGKGIIYSQITLDTTIPFDFDTITLPLPFGDIVMDAFVPEYDYGRDIIFILPALRAVRIRLSLKNIGKVSVIIDKIVIYLNSVPIVYITDNIPIPPNFNRELTIDVVDYNAYSFKIFRKIPPFSNPDTRWYYSKKYSLSKLVGYNQRILDIKIEISGNFGDNFFITKEDHLTLEIR